MKYPAYPRYKASGIEWLGDVPAHWEVSGFTKFLGPIIDYRGRTPEKVEDGVFLVTAKNIKNGKIDYEASQEFVRESEYEAVMRRGKPRIGEILFTTEAPLGEVANVDRTDIALAQRIIKLAGAEGILCNYFLKYWVMSSLFQQNLYCFATGSTALGIKASKLSQLRALLPSYDEQVAIVEYLDRETAKIETLIATQERLIELLQEKRQSLISHAITKGLNPDAPMKDSGIEWLGEIPAHWRVELFKRRANISYGVMGELDRTLTEGTRILSLPNVTVNGELELTEAPYVQLPDADKQMLLQKGDLLFNWRNGSSQHLGKTALFNEDGDFTHVSFLLRIRLDTEQSSPRYYQHLLNGLRTTGFFTASKASVNNTFNQSELANLWLIVPPLDEQQQIAAFLDKETMGITELVEKAKCAIELLEEHRTSLISAAVTGKIDVRNFATREPHYV